MHAHKIATRFILLDIGHLVIKGQHLVDINKVDIGDLVIKGQHLHSTMFKTKDMDEF